MKKQLTLLACMLLCRMLFSQAVPMALEEWRTTNGTQNFYYKAVTKTDPSGNMIVAGTTLDGATTDILVAKYNASGNQLWIHQFQGAATGGVDFAAGLFADNNYIYITGGVTNNSVTPETDCVTMKLASSTGSVVWSASYDGAGNFHDAGRHIVVDGSGNLYVSGGSYNASMNTDFLCLKYNSSGVQQWASTWDYLGFDDAATKGATSGSNLNLTGAVTTATPNVYKVATLSLSQSTGSLLATSVGTAVTTTSVDVVTDFISDGSGNIIVVGSNNVVGEGNNFYVQKLSNTLVSTWTYTWNGSASLNDVAKAVELDASGNVYIAGFSTSSTLGRELTLIKLNSSGTFQWLQTSGFSGDDEAADMIIDASSGIYVGGYKTNSTKDYYIAKYDASGTKIWETEMNSNFGLSDVGTNITLDSLTNVIITGQTETTPGIYNFTTVKYAQHDVITPTDFNAETAAQVYWYYRNEGQIRNTGDSLVPEVRFYTNNTQPGMFIKKNGMKFIISRVDSIPSTSDTLQAISLAHNNCNETAEVFPLEKQDFAISYFNGTGRDFPGISANAKLVTPNIYNNIDLMYSSNQNGIKYYYIVKPGGDMRDIQLEFTGATSYSLDAGTNALSLNTPYGNVTFERPTAYQLTAGNATVAVTSFTPDWQTNGASNKYKLNDGVYTTSLTLVIQIDLGNPTGSFAANANMMWNSYMGGNGDDNSTDMKLDRFGNIYTLEDTWSSTFYTNPNFSTASPSWSKQGSVIMKYSKLGIPRRQVYVTSNSNTPGSAIAVVNDSNIVLVGGNAGSNLSGPTGGNPNPSGAYTTTSGPGYILKFDKFFNNIIWSTRYPGEPQDADSKTNGDFYLCATTATVGALTVTETNATNMSPASQYHHGIIVSKFNQNGAVLWSSFVGAQGGQSWLPTRVKVDTTTNEFYVFGKALGSTNFVAYNNYGTFLRTTMASSTDAFIKKFNTNDSMVVSTYVGGNKDDYLADAVKLANGYVVFVGNTFSTDSSNITKNPYDSSYVSKKYDNSKAKGWVTKFDSRFRRTWATLYGDSLRETAFRCVTTDNINSTILIGGQTAGMPNVSQAGYYMKASDASADGCFVAFNDLNRITWATSMGVTGIPGEAVNVVQYNPKNQNLVFGGLSAANTNYPWVQFTGAYWQNFNFGASSGTTDCTVGRFDVVNITGVRELSHSLLADSDVLLFPNPATSVTNLYFKKSLVGKVNISIYNNLGQVMETRQYNSIADETSLQFNTAHLAEGIYFVNITTADVAKTIKFINFK